MQLTQKDIDRFWSKVKKAEGCWEWQSALTREGYGQFTVERLGSTRKDRRRKRFPAHRLAWELTNGPIPEGLCACHRCDNRRCVRPDHIFIGTPSENTQDRIAKGRTAKGAQSGYYRHPEKYQDFGKTENARKAREKAAAERSAHTLAYHLPNVIEGIRNIIAQGITPTKRVCWDIPGYSSIIGRFKTHTELVALAREQDEQSQ